MLPSAKKDIMFAAAMKLSQEQFGVRKMWEPRFELCIHACVYTFSTLVQRRDGTMFAGLILHIAHLVPSIHVLSVMFEGASKPTLITLYAGRHSTQSGPLSRVPDPAAPYHVMCICFSFSRYYTLMWTSAQVSSGAEASKHGPPQLSTCTLTVCEGFCSLAKAQVHCRF